MEFGFTEEQNLLRDSVRKLMQKHAPPEYVRKHDRERRYPEELFQAFAQAGLLALPFPEQYGGAGGSLMDMVVVAEEIARVSADLVMAYSGNIFCGLNLLRKASEEQKRYWLPKLFAGEIKFSISMSEPDAGSDIGAMRTTAVRDGNQWVIDGQKIWASMAGADNNVINLYVKTDPKAHYRQGLSLFLVDKDTPGLTLRKLDMLGRRATGTYELTFDKVRVPPDRLVGGENKGWDVVLAGLQVERAASSAGNVGAAQGVVDLAVQYAKDRKQFGRPIGSNQALAHMLADMQTEVEAARTLMWRAAWMVSTGQDALREITMAKLFTSETYVKIASQGMQVLGGFGYSEEFDMERHFRDSRAATIAAGTSQIQRNLIANLMGLKVQ
ncbi:MAG TPA: acyl-CoA dehydrogenase family protein [Xanthobacteraceae bacterium]|nr:acyl-CoA dehydrogenase family protein [Xanthobacteraceae bacterium]